jgi:hypothetical protein
MKCDLVTDHVCPPIPSREYDWCAYQKGEEGSGRYGWGSNEELAVMNWHELYGEDSGIKVGKYLVEKRLGRLWISIIDDGEGGEFDEAELEKVIANFYNENF